MAESGSSGSDRRLTVRHRGRIAQIGIFFRKFLRMFVFQSDWKMLPMAALIAGLVGFTVGGSFGRTREGTLMGAFAIVCVCIWNGSFNSIQVICRERDVIKREHRSGMHISSYIMAHMMYQLLLCLVETVVTLIILDQMGMKFPGSGLFTPWLSAEVGVTMLLVTYASDLLSLWISALVHTTTTAMTLMPFVLIFQLIFSGCLFSLPKAVSAVELLTVSSPGLKAMASQKQINDLPSATVSRMLNMIDGLELEGKITLGQVIDALSDKDNKTISQLREISIGNKMTLRDIGEDLLQEDAYKDLRNHALIGNATVGNLIAALLQVEELDSVLSSQVGFVTTFGEAVDLLAASPAVQKSRGQEIAITLNIKDILDLAGRKETKALIESKVSESMYDPEYASTKENIIGNWFHLLLFVIAFSVLSIITLEFIDKDKR